MCFSSKKDTWFALFIWGVVILMGWLMIVDKSIEIYIVGVLTISLLLWLWYGTSYKIEEELLKIKSGPFRSTVKIGEIKRLHATKSLLAGAALSIDRIEILYGKYDIAIVSPKDRTEFIRVFLTIRRVKSIFFQIRIVSLSKRVENGMDIKWIAERFEKFAALECEGSSELYETLSVQII